MFSKQTTEEIKEDIKDIGKDMKKGLEDSKETVNDIKDDAKDFYKDEKHWILPTILAIGFFVLGRLSKGRTIIERYDSNERNNTIDEISEEIKNMKR